jgi:geranylgeranyl pyrophosphate synthase
VLLRASDAPPEPPVDLDAFLARERARAEAGLEAIKDAVLDGAPPALRVPMAYALETRGKRLRPILCVAAYRAVRGKEPPEELWGLAAAVEVVHTYSLVHDDLPCMDDDDLRRGRPTVHRVYGPTGAMLAGAALIPAAVRVLDSRAAALGLSAEVRSRLAVELCRAGGAAGMVGGQLLDLEGEDKPVDADGLERIHRGKTAALLAASLRIGGIVAGATDAQLAALTLYGEDLGLAFQIVDDILDVVGDTEALGKPRGSDETLGKCTYPSLFGVDGARELAGERVDEAVAALGGAGLHAPELEALAYYVLERHH